MSGIVGYWSYASCDIPAAIFAGFADSLAHRGPDGCGIAHFPDVRLWLGHRRLTVCDRASDPRQPLADLERRYWLTYDGEIYNDRALRDELRALGHCFETDSTGEVILASYAQWGRDCLARFNGMWAFAIWDSRLRRLFLARDNFGIKPLHFALHRGAVAFASELKSFLRLPWIDGTFDPKILAATLAHVDEQEATSATLLPGVYRLSPGRALAIDISGTLRTNVWWNPRDQQAHPAIGLLDQAKEFRALLLEACKSCLQAGAPLAVEQSGGLDSSAIACCVAALEDDGAIDAGTGSRRRAFVACFADRRHDEFDRARKVAAHVGTELERVDIDDRQARDVIEQVIYDHENIFGFPRVGAWILYRTMRVADIRVSLSGIGIDDVFGSDTDYVEAALDAALRRHDLGCYRELHGVLRGMAGGNIEIGRASAWGEFRWHLRGVLATLHLLEPIRRICGRHGSDGEILRSATKRIAATSLDTKRHRDFRRVTPLYLSNFDRASAAHGVEVRMPFMDRRIVAYGFALPERSRNGAGQTKRVMRLAMAGMIPDPIRLCTSKTAFTVPLDSWARGALKPWLLDICASRAFLDNDIWHGPTVRRAVERAVAGEAGLHPVWPIIQAHVLQRAFITRAGAAFNAAPESEVVTL